MNDIFIILCKPGIKIRSTKYFLKLFINYRSLTIYPEPEPDHDNSGFFPKKEPR